MQRRKTDRVVHNCILTVGLVGGLAEEGGELALVGLVAAAGAEAGEGAGGLDEGVVGVEPVGGADGVVAVGQHGVVHVLRVRYNVHLGH